MVRYNVTCNVRKKDIKKNPASLHVTFIIRIRSEDQNESCNTDNGLGLKIKFLWLCFDRRPGNRSGDFVMRESGLMRSEKFFLPRVTNLQSAVSCICLNCAIIHRQI